MMVRGRRGDVRASLAGRAPTRVRRRDRDAEGAGAGRAGDAGAGAGRARCRAPAASVRRRRSARAECDIADARARARAAAPGARPTSSSTRRPTPTSTAPRPSPSSPTRVNAAARRDAGARAPTAAGAALVHYSTDFVFDGERERPYDESDPPSPQGVYARSKVAGERRWRRRRRGTSSLRVGCLYGRGGRNFPSTIVRRLRAGETVRADRERLGSPTWVARGRARLGRAGARPTHYGLYHCTSQGETSWADFARFWPRELLGCRTSRVEAVPTSALPMKAPRPRRAILDNRMLRARGLDTLVDVAGGRCALSSAEETRLAVAAIPWRPPVRRARIEAHRRRLHRPAASPSPTTAATSSRASGATWVPGVREMVQGNVLVLEDGRAARPALPPQAGRLLGRSRRAACAPRSTTCGPRRRRAACRR